MTLRKNEAFWTYDSEANAYYFAPVQRAQPPYKTQRQVTAVLDVASDGTLAGVELVMGDLPRPKNNLLGLLAQWEEEDAAEPDPGFDIDFAELEAESESDTGNDNDT